MPRIDAPTVAEHHQMRRETLLAAGIEILATSGPSGLTHPALGRAAGIARTSVYQYFPSRDALIKAVIDHAFSSANAHLASRADSESSPVARIAAYVEHAVARASDATHRVFAEIPRDRLSPAHHAQLDELHHAALAPLSHALEDLGVADPEFMATVIDSMIQATSRRILAGDDPSIATPLLVAAVVRGPLAVA